MKVVYTDFEGVCEIDHVMSLVCKIKERKESDHVKNRLI